MEGQGFSLCKLAILVCIFYLNILGFVDCRNGEDMVLTLVDEGKHLQRSSCNSLTWFHYVENIRELETTASIPERLMDNFSKSKGIWYLGSEPYARTTFDNPAACMDWHSLATLYEGMHFHYFLHSQSGSNFSIYDHSGENLLAVVNEPSEISKDGKWDHITIHKAGTFYTGFKVVPHIFKKDFLLIDKVSGRMMTSKEGHSNHRRSQQVQE